MKQNKSSLSVFVAGSKMRLNEKGLLMLNATPTASLLYCMRRVGYHLLSQWMEYILTDLESTCQVCCWNIKMRIFCLWICKYLIVQYITSYTVLGSVIINSLKCYLKKTFCEFGTSILALNMAFLTQYVLTRAAQFI